LSQPTGRGFWVIDDISPLRQITEEVAKADAYLFKPADAINVIQVANNGTGVQKDEPQAQNPPNGAYIDYYLKSAATGTVTLEILDGSAPCCSRFRMTRTLERGAGPRRRRIWRRRAWRPAFQNTTILWRTSPSRSRPQPACIASSVSPGGGGRGGGGFVVVVAAAAVAAAVAHRQPARSPRDSRERQDVTTQTFTIKPDPRSR